MIRKILLSVFLVTIAASAASMMGLEALGKPTEGASAITLGRGYAGGAKVGSGIVDWNPASLAFEKYTSFNATMTFEENVASKSDKSYASSTLEIPLLSFVFALHDFGTIAVALSQKYSSNFDEEVSDSTQTNLASLKYQGNIYEITPSYAVRLPFFRRLSLGFTAHFVMGSVSRKLTLGGDNSEVAETDAWATNSSDITEPQKVLGKSRIIRLITRVLFITRDAIPRSTSLIRLPTRSRTIWNTTSSSAKQIRLFRQSSTVKLKCRRPWLLGLLTASTKSTIFYLTLCFEAGTPTFVTSPDLGI